MTPQEIIEFIFFPVVNEGCRVVAGEQWVRTGQGRVVEARVVNEVCRVVSGEGAHGAALCRHMGSCPFLAARRKNSALTRVDLDARMRTHLTKPVAPPPTHIPPPPEVDKAADLDVASQ